MDKWLNKTVIVLAAIGLVVAVYMTIYKITNNNAMCLGSGDCSAVNASRYSEVHGIPVALIGVGGYLAILGLHFLENRNAFLRRNASLFFFGIALTGFLFTLYLIYVEIALLKAICPFCLASQIVMTILFILSVIRLVREPQQ